MKNELTLDDVRMTARLVVDKRVLVSDASVMAMAQRLLALEANHQKAAEEATLRARAEADLADAVAAEREACATSCDREAEVERPMVGSTPERDVALRCARRIRARGGPVTHEGSPSLVEASRCSGSITVNGVASHCSLFAAHIGPHQWGSR